MTKGEFDKFVDDVLGLEEVFPTRNQYPYETLMEKVGLPIPTVDDLITLQPGDEFRINADGSALVTRNNGTQEKFYLEPGRLIINLKV